MAPTHPLPTAFTEFYWVFQSQPNLTLFFLFSGTATNSDDGGAAANGASDAMVTPERCKWTSAEVKKKKRSWNDFGTRWKNVSNVDVDASSLFPFLKEILFFSGCSLGFIGFLLG